MMKSYGRTNTMMVHAKTPKNQRSKAQTATHRNSSNTSNTVTHTNIKNETNHPDDPRRGGGTGRIPEFWHDSVGGQSNESKWEMTCRYQTTNQRAMTRNRERSNLRAWRTSRTDQIWPRGTTMRLWKGAYFQLTAMIKVATWNICLGLKNKKDYIFDMLIQEKIDICALQEVDVDKTCPYWLMSSKDYRIEIE